MKRSIKIILTIFVLFFGITSITHADATTNLTIRDGSTIVFSGTVALPTGVTSLNDTTSVPHSIDANSVLAVLSSASTQSGATFSLSNLTYFSSFDSLYLKCITISGTEKCDNWQYAVNNSYPSVGMDKDILSGGENVYVYFGPQNKITLNSNTIITSDTLTVTAQKYDYQNNDWISRTGVIAGLTQPDPNNPYTPIEVKTEAVDTNGQAIFTSITAGSYNVGIKEDYYFPTEALTVTTPPPPPAVGNGEIITYAGGSTPPPPILPIIKAKFDLKKAFDFLATQQKENGSFDEDLYTDWTALALASGNNQAQVLKLIKYLVSSKPENQNLTDYERHAMALMSLGLNPYNTNGENYIEKIVNSFDGKQFGDANEDNDDIFALIVLNNTGYTQNDKMINDDISFILSKQKENGSFDESIDMTGAAIEALSVFSPIPGIGESLKKAENFLKQNQKDEGGWKNASSTAWALEGIISLDEKPEDWIKDNPIKNEESNTPLDYLATMQDVDGGIKNDNLQNKIWETAYVTSILSGKTWNQIMQKFEKPKEDLLPPSAEKESPKQIITKIIIKKPAQIAKTPKPNIIQKLENPKNTDTATAINAISNSPIPTQAESPKKNWFARLLENIFGF